MCGWLMPEPPPSSPKRNICTRFARFATSCQICDTSSSWIQTQHLCASQRLPSQWNRLRALNTSLSIQPRPSLPQFCTTPPARLVSRRVPSMSTIRSSPSTSRRNGCWISRPRTFTGATRILAGSRARPTASSAPGRTALLKSSSIPVSAQRDGTSSSRNTKYPSGTRPRPPSAFS